ncbi:unnamed protein product [Effrenium voratum]|uniref:Pentatricopeptide repeat-containing protein, chloroplastic n=1 Tax=Effrenium voratum TaxID=2562239 RepID=A0AA36I3F3_9DINO|nr:unnamed protein product [Effrenium voratum]CAJ1454236.1 unnamed protein product [Effrenium voratum]
MRSQSLESDIVLWNSIASAAYDGGRWLLSLAVLDAAPQVALHWTAVSFTTAGAAARSWLRSMEFLRRGLDLGISSGAVCNAALSACAEGRRWQQALALLAAAERRDADVIAFSACISACAGAQEWQQALVVFERCQPDEVACTACISACAAGLQWQLAFGLFQENAAALAAAQRAHVEQFGLRRPGLANSPGSSCSF